MSDNYRWHLQYLLGIVCIWLTGTVCVLGETIEVFRGEWKRTNGVDKLYETPLGAVYRFVPSQWFGCQPYSEWKKEHHKPKCNCSQCQIRRTGIRSALQCSFLKSNAKNHRFVVLEFSIRAFPALDRKKASAFRFQITRSPKTKFGRDYGDLNGILKIDSRYWTRFSTACESSKIKSQRSLNGLYYRPRFEPLAVRVIFDTVTGNKLITMLNSETVIESYVEKPLVGERFIEVRNFGIISQKGGSDKKYREEYLEISDPIIRQFDSETVIKKLPPLTFRQYPYERYAYFLNKDRKLLSSSEDEWRKVRQNNNPDLQYAYALTYLYGNECSSDPERAVELLKRASRKEHVFALYQLGVCYYRGYGVEIDYEQAIRYLEESASYGHTAAAALKGIILWKQAGQPLFPSAELYSELKKTWLDGDYFWGDHDRFVFGKLFMLPGAGPLETSPKSSLYIPNVTRRNFEPSLNRSEIKSKLQFGEYAIREGYYRAYFEIGNYLRDQYPNLSEIQKQAMQQKYWEQGARYGDIKCIIACLNIRALKGNLSEKDFSPEQELLLGDDASYNFWKLVFNHPRIPGIAEFLAGDRRRALDIWYSSEVPLERLLWGLYWFGLGERHVYSPLASRLTQTGKKQTKVFGQGKPWALTQNEAFKYIKRAAQAEIPTAMYWVARQCLKGDMPENDLAPYSKSQAVKMLEQVAADNFKAASLLVETKLKEQVIDTNSLLKYLEPICALNNAYAFHLKGKVLSRAKKENEAEKAYQKAIELGDYQAYRELILLKKGKGESEEIGILWKKFISADLKARQQDQYDVYWPHKEVDQWTYVDQPGISEQMKERLLAEEKRVNDLK